MKLYREFTSQEEIDAAYNVELSVPDFGSYANFYVEQSAKARAELACELDLRFGPTVDETLDIFPAADPNAPIMVFIHGGYWRRLSSKEFSLVARAPVAAGYTVVITNYSLCPAVSISEITRQSRAAIAWLYQTDHQYAGARNRIYVCGHSAGGHQTAMALSTNWEHDYALPADIVKGGLSISGLFDLRPLRYSWLQPQLLLNHEVIQQQSPHLNIPDTAPPLMLTVGGEEPQEFLRQSADFHLEWRKAGLTSEYDPIEQKNHFNVLDGFLDPSSKLMDMLRSITNR
ncbi:MAG: alpha/beta hydrolase [Pseudomonadota bacterium]